MSEVTAPTGVDGRAREVLVGQVLELARTGIEQAELERQRPRRNVVSQVLDLAPGRVLVCFEAHGHAVLDDVVGHGLDAFVQPPHRLGRGALMGLMVDDLGRDPREVV